ncbi:MAG: MFS transporter [Chloroflexi bacterium]|nr:MFS transporter [Chloroflexota bacterium]
MVELQGKYRWLMLGVLVTVQAMARASSQTLGLMLPLMTKELDISPFWAGWLGSSGSIGSALLALPFSWWLSRYSPKALVMVSSFAGSLFILAQGVAGSFPLLFGARLMVVVSTTLQGPARALLLQQWFLVREMTWANGAMTGFAEVVVALAIAGTPFIMAWLGGWRQTLVFFAALLFFTGLVWLFAGKERVTQEYQQGLHSQERAPIGAVLKYKELWLAGASFFASELQWAAFLTFWPTYLRDVQGVALSTAGYLQGLSFLAAFGSYFVCGLLMDRMGRRRPLVWACGLLKVPVVFVMLASASPLVLIVGAFFNGFTWLFFPAVQAMPYELKGIRPREVAVATALMMTMLTMGAVAGPLITGSLYQASGSLYLGLAVAGFFPLITALSGIFLPEREEIPTKVVGGG